MRPLVIDALIALQAYVVTFIALHDWIPLGRLNNLEAVHAADPRGKLIAVTVLSAAPFLVGLIGTLAAAGGRFPAWLTLWLWVGYGLALLGMINSWWAPYLLGRPPERIARNKAMFAATHAFLPRRHGFAPNTLHVTLHATVVAILVLLAVLTF